MSFNKEGLWLVLLLSVFGLAGLQAAGAQTGLVTGRVTDATGAALAHVTVSEKGRNNYAETDEAGAFRITVHDPRSSVLVFSSIGYERQEVPLAGRTSLTVTLEDTINELDEVVAIGYGMVKKRDLTGAVASVRGEELMRTNPTSINQALQGKVAGVVVNQADGAPGAGISIQIRGANSFTTSTEPLYVIDGVPFNGGNAPSTDYATKQTNNPLNLINPRDVVSIEILKDASATAIYGSRGANGVVLITTKSGQKGKTRVEFSSNVTMSNPVSNLPVLDAATYAEYRNEMERNKYTYDGGAYVDDADLPFPIPGRYSYQTIVDPETGQEIRIDSTFRPGPQDFRDGYMGGGTDWQDQIFQTAWSQEYNLGISGGDDKGTFMFGLGSLDQQGVILNSYFKRYNIRSNVERKITDWFHFGNFLTASKSQNRFARTNTETYGIIPTALSFNPTRSIFDPDEPSGVSEDFANGLSNPYLYVRTAKNLLGSITASNSTYAQINFTDFLNFRQNLGYYYSQNERDIYYNRYISGGVSPINGYGAKSDNYYESLTLQSTLNFNKPIGTDHRVDGVLGWTYENVNWGGKNMSGSNFPNDITENNDMGAALLPNPLSSSRGKSSLLSFLGRVNYSFRNRYLFTVNFRRDGSSRLSPKGRWANFSSFALAWQLSEEPFIKNLDVFDQLKLRAGYGETGNQGVNAYATRSRMTAQNYPYDGTLYSGYAEDRWGGPAAPNLKWENTKQVNLGLDATFWDNRISVVVDLYEKRTTDLLQYAYIPMSTGFSTIATNYGNVYNRGLEISANTTFIRRTDLNWSMNANIAFNRNKIDGLDADQFSDVVWGMESMFLRRNGLPIGTLYGYVEDGFYDNEAEVRADNVYRNESDAKIRSMIGQVKYRDLNGDGVVDNRDKDIIGDTNPKFTYGMTHNITYRDFMLSFFFQGTYGNDILNANLRAFDVAGTVNIPQFVWDQRWTPDNKENAKFPRPDITYTRSLKASDRFVENGSYLRLKNVSFSYRWDAPIPQIGAVNVTLSANNVFTITKYRWYDPDVNAFGSDPARRGIDMASYPSARTYTLGIQVSF